MLVVSGYNHLQQWLGDVEVYDPSTDVWTVVPMFTSHGVEHIATLMNDGRVLVVGSARDRDCCWTEDSYAREIEVYDPATGLWYTVEQLPQAGVYSASLLLLDGRVLITKGQTGECGTTFLSELWFYPPLSTQP